jgi:drug/metabolite transporter (DMT)-like permease
MSTPNLSTPPQSGLPALNVVPRPVPPMSFGRDVLHLARLHLAGTLGVAAFAVVWFAASTTYTLFMTGLFTSLPRSTALAVGVALSVLNFAATWVRFARQGTLRGVASVVMAVVLAVWVIAGVAHPLAGSGFGIGVTLSTVGCVCLGNLLVVAAIEQRRTGSRTGHSLYRFYDTAGRLLYVGITNSPRLRFAQHRDSKTWWPTVAVREITHYSSRAELEAAEKAAIRRERPRYNIAHNGRRR